MEVEIKGGKVCFREQLSKSLKSRNEVSPHIMSDVVSDVHTYTTCVHSVELSRPDHMSVNLCVKFAVLVLAVSEVFLASTKKNPHLRFFLYYIILQFLSEFN